MEEQKRKGRVGKERRRRRVEEKIGRGEWERRTRDT
jgi:hypothetical protein